MLRLYRVTRLSSRALLGPGGVAACRRALPRPCLRLQSTAAPARPNIIKRVGKFLRDNPFTKFSLALCGIVLGLSLAVEFYNKVKKKRAPEVIVHLPRVGHYTVDRPGEVAEIERCLSSLRSRATVPVVIITATSGAGKSELVAQFAKKFVETSTKWFGLKSVTPTVLFLNGTNEQTFELSLREAALAIGLKDGDFKAPKDSTQTELTSIATALHSKLSENKVPWLLVVDNLTEQVHPSFSSTFAALPCDTSGWSQTTGSIVVTTNRPLPVNEDHAHLSISDGLRIDTGLELLSKLAQQAGGLQDDRAAVKLLEQLQGSPMAIALAAGTISCYQTFVESHTPSPLEAYSELLEEGLREGGFAVLPVAVALYCEAYTAWDPRFQLTFDLLGSCDLQHPVPVSLIERHLSDPFYALPEGTQLPDHAHNHTPELKAEPERPEAGWRSYVSLLRSMWPFGQKQPSNADLAAMLFPKDDKIAFLRGSPLLSFKEYSRSGFEFVQIHASAVGAIPALFLSKTVPRLDREQLTKAEESFQKSAWFRQYRTFDPEKALSDYHRSLPGGGVHSEDNFTKLLPSLSRDPIVGTLMSKDLRYSEYQHLASHYHRVGKSLLAEVKSVGGGIGTTQLRRYLNAHFKVVRDYPLVSDATRLACDYSLASIKASLSTENLPDVYTQFEEVLERQRELYGSQHCVVARTITDMADLDFSMNRMSKAKQLLDTALHIYQRVPSNAAPDDFAFDVALTMSSLAIVCSSLGEKEACKTHLEQALALYQTLPPDGVVTMKQRRLVASTLTDVGHAYLALGDLTMAKKYIDLSVVAHQNLYLDGHSESVRALNVASTVYALLGDKPESQRVRMEAGKLQKQINTQSMLA